MNEPGDVRLPAWRVGVVCLSLGAVAFGGLGPALALLDRDLVAKRGWLRSEDVRDALTYTKPLPGSTVAQVVTFLGYRLGGIRGAAAATVGFLLPAAVFMVGAAAATAALPDAAWVDGALLGLQVAVVGLLAHALAELVSKEARTPGLACIAGLAAAAGFVVNPAVVVTVAGIAGLAVARLGISRGRRRG